MATTVTTTTTTTTTMRARAVRCAASRRAGASSRVVARGSARRASGVAHASEEDVATRERAAAFGALALGAVAMAIGSGVADAGDAMTAFAATGAADAMMDNAAATGATPREVFSLAGGEVPFWANMVKYARFSISIMVGFAYMFGRPVVGLLKKPQTAALVVAVGAGGYVFFKFTIESMLGVNDPSTFS